MQTVRWLDLPDGLRLVGHTVSDPDPKEWAQLIAELQPGPDVRTLVISDGGTPNLRQRKDLNVALWREKPPRLRTAVVSSSAEMRAVLKAVTWLGNNEMRVFSPHDLSEAFKHLDVEGAEKVALQRAIDTMCEALDLRLFRQAQSRTMR